MLEIHLIRNQPEKVVQGLAKKHFKDPQNTIDDILKLDEKVRGTIRNLEQLRNEMNSLAKQIGAEIAKGNVASADEIKKKTSELKTKIPQLEAELAEAETQLNAALVELPNLPNTQVPDGRKADDNFVSFLSNRKIELPATKKPHWELAAQHGIIDFELGSKVTGAGFPVYIGKGAKLQRALIQFFLDKATDAGYTEIQPPILINEASGYATGQLPDKEGQMYYATEDKYYLIPTAEVPITNLYRDRIINYNELPIKNCGYTPCFRREAGSYGKDVRGLNRLHQFDKVEIVQITNPENSYAVLEEMKLYVAGLLEDLELPYRTLLLCGGDMSFASAMTYDMEVYSAGQDRWLEVSSVSNFETFQSNRMKLRCKTHDGKNVLAHTLNGSALALPRIVAALLENNQLPDGRIAIPTALQKYTGFNMIG